MQQFKFILVTSLIISCMADDMKKHQGNDTMTGQKVKDMKPASGDTKTMKDDKSMPSHDAKPTSTDHTIMGSKMVASKTIDSKMMDSKTMDSKTMGSKTMESKPTKDAPAGTESMAGAAHQDSNEQLKTDQMPKSKEDMKAESTVGLGFYGGVVPVSYGGYGYGYGYPSYPYYSRSYYARPYYSYPYRPIVPVIVKPRPVPLLLG